MRKRLFLAFKAKAQWPEIVGEKIIAEDQRHLTLVFWKEIEPDIVLKAFSDLKAKTHPNMFSGQFDKILQLPPRHPRVWALHACLSDQEGFDEYFEEIKKFLSYKKLFTEIRKQKFLPHVSFARSKDVVVDKIVLPLPFILSHLQLYESLGNSTYGVLDSIALQSS